MFYVLSFIVDSGLLVYPLLRSSSTCIKDMLFCVFFFFNPVFYYKCIFFIVDVVVCMFATKSDSLILISLQPYVVDFRHFKLWILLDQIILVWNSKGLHHKVAKGLENLSLWQRLNCFIFFTVVLHQFSSL